jgi:PIN domain nuclease of toxin-antitoxin system
MPAIPRVLDSSVVLAAMLGEMPTDEAEPWLSGACISAVNFAEVVTRLADRGMPPEDLADSLLDMDLDVRPFDQVQAHQAGLLRSKTRDLGLSLGDRACLALAAQLGLSVATGDKAWAKLDIGIKIELIR